MTHPTQQDIDLQNVNDLSILHARLEQLENSALEWLRSEGRIALWPVTFDGWDSGD